MVRSQKSRLEKNRNHIKLEEKICGILSWDDRDIEDPLRKGLFEKYLDDLVEQEEDPTGLIAYASFYIFGNDLETINDMISRWNANSERKEFVKYLKSKIKEIKNISRDTLKKLNLEHGFRLLITESILSAMGIEIRDIKQVSKQKSFKDLYSNGVTYVWNSIRDKVLGSFTNLKKLDGGNVAESGVPMCTTPYRELIFFKREKSGLGNLKKEYVITKIINELVPELVGTIPLEFLENVNSLDSLIIYRYPGRTIHKAIEILDQFLDNPKYEKNKYLFREWLAGFTLDDAIDTYAKFQNRMLKFDKDKSKESGIELETILYSKEFNKKIRPILENKLDIKIISKIEEIAYELDTKNKIFSHMDLHSRNFLLWSFFPIEKSRYYTNEAVIDFGSVGFASKYYDIAFLIEQPSLALSSAAKISLIQRFIIQSATEENRQKILKYIHKDEGEGGYLLENAIDEYNKTALFVNAQLGSTFLSEKENLSFTKSNEIVAEGFIENINYYYAICNGEIVPNFKGKVSSIISRSWEAYMNCFIIFKTNLLNHPSEVALQKKYLKEFSKTNNINYLKQYERQINERVFREARIFERQISQALISTNSEYKETLGDIFPKIFKIYDEFMDYLKRYDEPPLFDYPLDPYFGNAAVQIFNQNLSRCPDTYKKIMSKIEANPFLE